MMNTKRQLRAEAVERLDGMRLDTGSAVKRIATILGVEWNPDNVPASVGALHNMLRYLLTDDELQEGDAVAIMRKVANGDEVTGNAMRKEVGGTDWSDALLILADMVERDYVRCDDYDFMADALKYMKAERDELKKQMDILRNAIREGRKERDEWRAKAEQAQESYLDAKQDRDAWIEKFKDAEHAMNAAAGKWAKADDENRELRKMLLLDDGTVEEYTERADPMTALAYQKQLAEEWRDRCHNAEAWCDELEAKSAKRAAAVERLKNDAGARFSPDAIVCALLDGRRGKIDWSLECDAILDLLTDDDGAARSNDGVTNLEWLYEHDDAFAYGAKKFVVDDGYSCCETLDQAHEWLMAPHEDGNGISDNLRKSQDSEIDSREQLESDACSLITRMIDDAYNMGLHEASWCANKQSIHECIKELLDRQATITKVECENTFLNRADEIITRRELEKRELQVESIVLGDKANAAEEMLLFLLEGGDPNWLGWHDDHDGLCDYFKERFDETVPELKERIATQKRTIESYRDDSRELQERVDDLVAENIKLIERTGELEDQLAATKRELKLVKGQLTTTLNNWEQAKGKLRRQKADLDARALNLEERENRTAEDVAFEKVEYWKGQCEKAREEAEVYRSRYGEAVNKAHEIIGGMD